MKQVSKFIFIGLISVSIDYSSYLLLSLIISVNLSKAISFILGSIFSFYFNKNFTFLDSSELKLIKILNFSGVYLSSLFMNVLINNALLFKLGIAHAFLIATFFSATYNFLLMKNFVFKN
ncbi:GtrA family protein [Gammaproteobacteria bacterium]|nr:GtrA family protein [Gammaproteobacteria bacterium]